MANQLLTAAIDDVASGRDLSRDQAAVVLAQIMAGDASQVEIAALLIGLRTKGETSDEIAGLAQTMRSLATPVVCERDDLVDTAGTGGGRSTFNVSTTAALIAAGAGCAVAKHGNRSATSKCGSADVLEALGGRINLHPEAVARCIDEAGFGFMFAPNHHAATRYVVPVRSQLAVRTIFNFLGPLTNPAGARRQLVGVSDPAKVESLARALAELGAERALVVSSEDGLDEMSTSAATQVVEVNATHAGEAEFRRYTVHPQECGLQLAAPEAVAGDTPQHNADVIHAILAGEHGPRADLALLNAGATIYAAGRSGSIAEGVEVARAAVASGEAAAVLERYVALSNELGGPDDSA